MADISAKHRRARIWDKCPGAGFSSPPGHALTAQFAPSGQAGKSCAIAIELMVPMGGKLDYVLLGASYEPTTSAETTEVAVMYTGRESGERPPYVSDLSTRWTRIGLPHEEAAYVLAGACAAIEHGAKFGPSRLVFNCAADDAAGSSPIMFQSIAFAVTRLIRMLPLTEEEIRRELVWPRWSFGNYAGGAFDTEYGKRI